MTKNWFLKLVETEIKSNQALKTQDSSLRGDSTICWPMMIKKLNEHLKQYYTQKEPLDSESQQTVISDYWSQPMYRQAHLSPAFVFAYDLQSVLPPGGPLHTLSDHSEVSIP